METTMVTRYYREFDEASKRARRKLQEVLVDCKKSSARKKKASKDLENATTYKTTNAFAAFLKPQQPQQHWPKKVRKAIRFAIITCARAENSAIIARISGLPRELRDKIYSHLWEPDGSKDPTRDLLYWWEDSDEEWMIGGVTSSKSHSLANTTDLRPPHFIDPAFVNREFATEVLEQLKDTIGKDMRFVGNRAPVAEFLLDHESIPAFVTDNVLGLGTTMDELVRNLDLRIDIQCDDIEHLNSPDPSEEEWAYHSEDSETYGAYESTSTVYPEPDRETFSKGLDDSLTSLLSIPYTERMIIHNEVSRCLDVRPRTITLVIRHGGADIEKSLVPILRLIRRAYNDLRDKEFTVKILYDNDSIAFRVLFEDEVWSWTEEKWRTSLEEKNTFTEDARYRDEERIAEVWRHLKNVLFSVENVES